MCSPQGRYGQAPETIAICHIVRAGRASWHRDFPKARDVDRRSSRHDIPAQPVIFADTVSSLRTQIRFELCSIRNSHQSLLSPVPHDDHAEHAIQHEPEIHREVRPGHRHPQGESEPAALVQEPPRHAGESGLPVVKLRGISRGRMRDLFYFSLGIGVS